MYMQEIVCPHCAHTTVVNVLDGAGTVVTRCQHSFVFSAHTQDDEGNVIILQHIHVTTNAEGKVTAIMAKNEARTA